MRILFLLNLIYKELEHRICGIDGGGCGSGRVILLLVVVVVVMVLVDKSSKFPDNNLKYLTTIIKQS